LIVRDLLGVDCQYKKIAIDSNNNIYACGYCPEWIIRRSTSGLSASFSTVDGLPTDSYATSIAIDSNNNIYVAGKDEDISDMVFKIRKSTTGISGSFVDVEGYSDGDAIAADIAIDSNNIVYAVGRSKEGGSKWNWILRKSDTGASASFSTTYTFTVVPTQHSQCDHIDIDSENNIYIGGIAILDAGGSYNGFVKKAVSDSAARNIC